ncbi:MAG: carboxymuconolactone decarboxylase family protein [Solirubrobacteraceae bacterium]
MPPKIPLPTDDDLAPEHREMLANLPPLNVFRMVAGAPRAVRPFLELGGAVLSTALDARRREIAVLRVAHATKARYEWAQHEQLGRSVGVTEAEIDSISIEARVCSLDDECNLICRVADEVSRDVRLSDDSLEQIIDRYGPREAAELILLVSYYNMVSRFLESTRVELENEPLLRRQTPSSIAREPGDDRGLASDLPGHAAAVGCVRLNEIVQGAQIVGEGADESEAPSLGDALQRAVDATNQALAGEPSSTADLTQEEADTIAEQSPPETRVSPTSARSPTDTGDESTLSRWFG